MIDSKSTVVKVTVTLITTFAEETLASFKVVSISTESESKVFNIITKSRKKIKVTWYVDKKYFYFKPDDERIDEIYELYFFIEVYKNDCKIENSCNLDLYFFNENRQENPTIFDRVY